MTKEEYAAEILRIVSEETKLARLKRETTNAYIAEHREYGDGDLVRLIYEDWLGKKEERIVFVGWCNTFEKGELYYGFYKVKKDGSQSNHRLRNVDNILTIELIKKSQP